MKKLAAIAFLFGIGARPVSRRILRRLHLNILHINDWHSRIESNNKYESTCSAEDEGKGECIGGAARLVTAIAEPAQEARGQERAAAQRRRQFPGLAVLHDLQGHGRSRVPEPDEVRRHDRRQPRVRRRRGRAGAVPRRWSQFPVLSANVQAGAAVEGRRPHQAVDRARCRRPEDRHRRRGDHRHARDRLARPQHHDRGRRSRRSPPRSRS